MNPVSSIAALGSDADSLLYNLESFLSGKHFIEIVMVTAVYGEAPNLKVDFLPLVTRTTNTGAPIPNAQVYGASVFRLQRGSSAIIMNPVVGDIGIALYCDKDSDNARRDRISGSPNTTRCHSRIDALYLGGLLNQQPVQFIEFADSAINITSPNPVNVTCSKANIIAPDGVTVDSPNSHFTGNITADGNITDNAGSQSSSVKALRDAYNKHKHPVTGVESGGSTVTSKAPEERV